MEQTYRIVAIGLKDGFTRAESAQLLAALFKRPAHEVTALTIGKRVIVKKSLQLPAAIKYKSALERCGLLAEVTPDTPSDRSRSMPLSAREVARMDTCARHVLATLQAEHGKELGYDARSIACVATDLNGARLSYTPEQTRKIARFYGAFLGKVLLDMFPHAVPGWVSTSAGVAIEFRQTASGAARLAYPQARIEQHIAHGEAKSIVTWLQELRTDIEGIQGQGKLEHSLLQLGSPDEPDRLDIAMPLSMCCNCATTNDVAVLDVKLAARSKGASALWMEMPFCGACTASADRVRPGIVKTGLLTAAAFLVTGLPVILLTDGMRIVGLPTTVLVVPAFAIAAGAVLYLLDKVRAPQTSRYQPVTLETFEHTQVAGRHVGFSFTNVEYAHAFAGLNAAEISAGRIATVY